jgi:hypothetical protein
MSREYEGDGSLLASDFIMGLPDILAQLAGLIDVVGNVSLKSILYPAPLRTMVELNQVIPS